MRIDLKKDRPDLYRPGSTDFVEVDVPPMAVLAIDGHGDPNTAQEYADAVAALYAAAYAVRFALKRRTGDEVAVGPLEGLWTSGDPSAFTARRKGEWDWTMLIVQPAPLEATDIEEGLAAARRKKPDLPVDRVRATELHEGRCLQIMHVGSYDDEAPTLARLHHEVIPALGLTFAGPHHEIYLSDPRRVAPEKLRTILRQPVR